MSGDILNDTSASFFLIHGTISPGFTSDYLKQSQFWSKGCYDQISSILTETPVLELKHDGGQYAFGFNMGTETTVGSFFLFTGDYYKAVYNEVIEGYVTVGDSTNYDQNPKCHSAVYGQGYYTCDQALNGKYIAFYATGQYSSGVYDSTGLHVVNFKVFSSANLITTATMKNEIPLANANSKSFSDNMGTLAPRVTTTASNVPGGTCG